MISISQPDVLWRDRMKRLEAVNRQAWKATDSHGRYDGSAHVARAIRSLVKQ